MQLDSVRREQSTAVISSIRDSVAWADPALAYARACVLGVEDPAGSMRWLLRAHALADSRDGLLAARIARDLGAMHLMRSEDRAAAAVLAWTTGLLGCRAEDSADLDQLAGLIADHAGDMSRARLMNERSVRSAAQALTPMTRVIGLSNLAAATTPDDPRTSVVLTRHALTLVSSEELHPSAEAAIRNVLGYALLPLGELTEARAQLSLAAEGAALHRYSRVELFAGFDLSIAAELAGDLQAAASRIALIRTRARSGGHNDLSRWADIRSMWLASRIGVTDLSAAAAVAWEDLSRPQRRAMRVMGAIDRSGSARDGELVDLARDSVARNDAVEGFALLLHVAARDHATGRTRAARRWVRQAEELALPRGLRLATNWWQPDLVDVVAAYGDPTFAVKLHRPNAPTYRTPVRISHDGEILVGREAMSDIWRQGRTGRRILHRFFALLLRSYPLRVGRDVLCDALWPESDGDRAVRDLYAATYDLRNALRATPGIRVTTAGGGYRLEFDPWVVIEGPSDNAHGESLDPHGRNVPA